MDRDDKTVRESGVENGRKAGRERMKIAEPLGTEAHPNNDLQGHNLIVAFLDLYCRECVEKRQPAKKVRHGPSCRRGYSPGPGKINLLVIVQGLVVGVKYDEFVLLPSAAQALLVQLRL